jgi:BMFP domain-containing protein YqiC
VGASFGGAATLHRHRAPVKAPKAAPSEAFPQACASAEGIPELRGQALGAANETTDEGSIQEMTQTTGRFFDELGRLITDAAGAADGVRKEIESVIRAQAERVLRDLDVVQREEFEAVKAMAQKAREENERLKERIAALEAAIIKGLAGKRG